MKVTNWRRKIAAGLVAAGIMVPGTTYAIDIPLLDPSFEDYIVPVSPGYAYAADPNGAYRPTSAWIDDLDQAGQDDAASNWLYDSSYAESGSTARKRPAPRTGNQAMHGISHYNAQIAQGPNSLFEVGMTYTFSVYAQGDDDATGATSRVWLYLFNGSQPFTEPTSLNFARYAPDTGDFANRAVGDTPEQSQAKWTQISISHTVFEGAPEIGQPVGVAFWGADDSAVDDATLRADDVADTLLILEVNTTNGQTRFTNSTGESIHIDYYEIESSSSSLTAGGWSSLQEQDMAGFPAGDGSGNGWEEAGGSTGSSTMVLSESYLLGNSAVADEAEIGLGAAFKIGGAQDLVFHYGEVEGGGGLSPGDFNQDGTVDAADYVFWRDRLGDANDYTLWQENFGGMGGPSGPGTLVRGYVRYVTAFSGAAVVPEPSSIILIGIGLGLAVAAFRRTDNTHGE
jgi:hypothetical protein